MTKVSKASVNYRANQLAPQVRRHCGNCSMYRGTRNNDPATTGQCTLVTGPIKPRGVCDRWAAR